ncbi:MAG: hypothetical protein H6704_00450 [Myxococcales bacterium]|nr:hypothetical protein [Myxococcales bacterium]
MSDDEDDKGMGMVKRRRSRRLLETRGAAEGPQSTEAASAWGDHLAASMSDDSGGKRPPTGPIDPLQVAAEKARAKRRATGPIDPLQVAAEKAGHRRATGPLSRPGTGPLGRPGTGPLGRPGTGPLGRPGTGPLRRPSTPPPNAAKPTSTPPAGGDEAEGADTGVEKSAHLRAAQLANAHDEHAKNDTFDAGARLVPGFQRLRPLLAGAVMVAGLGLAAVPVMDEMGRRADRARLAEVVDAQARRVAADNPGLADMVRGRRLPELRALYAAEQPKVIAALKAAGFEEASERTLSIRLDPGSNGLILSAGFGSDDDDRPVRAQASTSGQRAGRGLPEVGFGPSLSAHLPTVLSAVLGAAVIAVSMWVLPAVLRRS